MSAASDARRARFLSLAAKRIAVRRSRATASSVPVSVPPVSPGRSVADMVRAASVPGAFAFLAVMTIGLGVKDVAQRRDLIADQVMMSDAARHVAEVRAHEATGTLTWRTVPPVRRSI